MNTLRSFHESTLLDWELPYNQKLALHFIMTFKNFLDKTIGSLASARARLCCFAQWERERERGERRESESHMAAGNLGEKKAPEHLHAFSNMFRKTYKSAHTHFHDIYTV